MECRRIATRKRRSSVCALTFRPRRRSGEGSATRTFSRASPSCSRDITDSSGRHTSRWRKRLPRDRAPESGTRSDTRRTGRAYQGCSRWSIGSGARMRDLKISKRADPAYVEAFRTLVQRLLRSVGSKVPIAMYLAGGAAMHFYTGSRMTDDVDAVFSRKLLLPADLAVIHRDAVRLSLKGVRGARIFVLQPLDLAVSKLARFADVDRADILDLARNRLITARSLRERAEAALSYYVGNPVPVRTSIDLVCRDIESMEAGGDRNGNLRRKT